MRLLHTSDWHIGINNYDVNRQPDHDKVFADIRNLAIDDKVDLILHTGDLFDVPFPAVDSLKYGWSVLEDLAALGIPVVVLCGNHDGYKLFELMGMILKNRLPIYLVNLSTLREKKQESILTFPTAGGETLKIGCLPFVKNSSYIRDYIHGDPTRATVTYADEVGAVEHQIGEWLNAGYDPKTDIRVFAAHLMVEGAQVGGGEQEMYIQRDYVTRPERIPTADYVAFGHIHKAQQIARIEHGRYAGSPLPLDFGERNDIKSVYIVSGQPGRALTIEQRKLNVGRSMLDIEGTLETLREKRMEYQNTIARVFVDLEAPVSELDRQVRELLPDTTICRVIPRYPAVAGIDEGERDEHRPQPTLNEMFEQYAAVNPGLGETGRLVRYFNEFLHQVREGTETPFKELEEAQA